MDHDVSTVHLSMEATKRAIVIRHPT